MDARKYIIVPEYKPLYAMAECWGQTHGPLNEPCPVPIDIIGKLLLQTGKEAVNIYEVKKDPKSKKGDMLPPVKLTLDNYRKPYEEIAGIEEELPDTSLKEAPKTEPVNPIEINTKPEMDEPLTSVAPENPNVTETPIKVDKIKEGIDPSDIKEKVTEPTEDASDESVANDDTETVTAEEVSKPEETEESVDTTVDPYAGMTKAERKRARREARARLGEDNI